MTITDFHAVELTAQRIIAQRTNSVVPTAPSPVPRPVLLQFLNNIQYPNPAFNTLWYPKGPCLISSILPSATF